MLEKTKLRMQLCRRARIAGLIGEVARFRGATKVELGPKQFSLKSKPITMVSLVELREQSRSGAI